MKLSPLTGASRLCVSLAVALLCTCAHSGRAVAGKTELSKLSFPVGETLIYRIYWGVLPVGTVAMTSERISHNGKQMVALRYRCRTNQLFDRLYPADDCMESIVDPVTFLPVQYTQVLSRRRWQSNEVTTFDHAQLKGHWQSRTDSTKKTFKISPKQRDILTQLYHMRSGKLNEKKELTFPMVFDDGVGETKVKTGKTEKIKVGIFGKVKSLRMEPAISSENILVAPGKITMWVSQGSRMVCTKIIIRAPLAKIRTVLHRVFGPGNDLWTKATAKRAEPNEDWLERVCPPRKMSGAE